MKNLLSLLIVLFISTSNAQEIKFGKVSKQELEEKINPLDSTADAAYLLNKRKTYFSYDVNNGWMINTEYHQRIKIYTKEGLEYATKKINYRKPDSGEKESINSLKSYSFNLVNNKIEKTKLSKKDIFDEKLNEYRSRKTVTFPNTKEGTIIDLKYKIKSPYWSINPVIFEYNVPVKQLTCTVEIPEYFTFNKNYKGYFSIPVKETEINRQLLFSNNNTVNYSAKKYTFTQENINAVNEKEPYARNINNYRGKAEFELSGTKFPNSMYKNYTTTWEAVCKTIFNASEFGDELKRSSYYKDDLAAILKSAKSDTDKIILIYNLVKSKIKWNEYHGKYTEKGVKKAYKDGSGNVAEINLMLTSMLRSAGLNSNPVLISTKDSGVPLFPTRNGFNYVISKVNLKDGTYVLLDASEKYSFANILPYRTLNWSGREILANGNSREVDLIPTKHTKENNILYVKIDTDLGEVNGMFRKSLTGHTAMFYRQLNNIKKEEDVITAIEEKYNIEVDDFKISNKNNAAKPITQTLKFTSEDLIEEVNGKLYFSPLLFLATTENPFKSEKRNFPIDYIVPWQDKFTVSITIPENYTVESFPKETAIALPDNLGIFKYLVSIQGNKIKLSSVLQINSHIVNPQYYTAIKDFYKQLVEKQTENIVLIKK